RRTAERLRRVAFEHAGEGAGVVSQGPEPGRKAVEAASLEGGHRRRGTIEAPATPSPPLLFAAEDAERVPREDAPHVLAREPRALELAREPREAADVGELRRRIDVALEVRADRYVLHAGYAHEVHHVLDHVGERCGPARD